MNVVYLISMLVTTGVFGDVSVIDEKYHAAAIVNAVTGRVEVDRFVCVVFTQNTEERTNGTYKPVRSTGNGKVLLDGWETMQGKVSFDEHLQDVVDILQHLLGGDRVPRDISTALLFVHRRAFPKLASRVKKAVRLWGGAPSRVILQYYKTPHNSAIKVTGSLFLLCAPEGNLHHSLEIAGLPRDSSYSSSIDGERRYVVLDRI